MVHLESHFPGIHTTGVFYLFLTHFFQKDLSFLLCEKDADDGVARKEETCKAKKEVYGCGERG